MRTTPTQLACGTPQSLRCVASLFSLVAPWEMPKASGKPAAHSQDGFLSASSHGFGLSQGYHRRMSGDNLLGVPETLLPNDPAVTDALAELEQVRAFDLGELVKKNPKSSLLWALLSDELWAVGATLPSYAYARVGYHRGLDALRAAGWRGQGPVPWSHEPNRGVLRSLYALRRAAESFGETDEVERLTTFLNQSDRTAIAAIEATVRPVETVPVTEAIIIRGQD
jgi:hypothetical protein